MADVGTLRLTSSVLRGNGGGGDEGSRNIRRRLVSTSYGTRDRLKKHQQRNKTTKVDEVVQAGKKKHLLLNESKMGLRSEYTLCLSTPKSVDRDILSQLQSPAKQ